jgi:hypothetical protein
MSCGFFHCLISAASIPAAPGIGLLSQCFQGSSKAAFMTCSLVFMDDFLVSDTIDGRHGSQKNLRCSRFVARFNRLANSFDCCTQCRTLTGIVSVLLDCLTSAFTCLCGICHEYYFLKQGRRAFANTHISETEFCEASDYSGILPIRQIDAVMPAGLLQQSVSGRP